MNLLECIEEPKSFEIKVLGTDDKLAGEILTVLVERKPCLIKSNGSIYPEPVPADVYTLGVSIWNTSKNPYHIVEFSLESEEELSETDIKGYTKIDKPNKVTPHKFKPIYLRQHEFASEVIALPIKVNKKPVLCCKIAGFKTVIV